MDIYAAIGMRRTVRDFEDRFIDMEIVEKIIGAGLKAPTNDHMRSWEFVVINDKNKRAEILEAIPQLKTKSSVNKWLDSWGSTDRIQRDTYLDAVPKQYAMLYQAGCLILPFFRHKEELLQPTSLSSLNGLASIWCCVENMLLAAASEGIFGVTRIPGNEESQRIKSVLHHPDDYIMPCYIALGYPKKDFYRAVQKEILVKDRIHIDAW